MANRAVDVAPLVERSLPTPEVHSSNPVIGKIKLISCRQLYWKDENKEKEAGIDLFLKRQWSIDSNAMFWAKHELSTWLTVEDLKPKNEKTFLNFELRVAMKMTR